MRIKANRIALVASIGIALTGCQAIDDIVSAEQVDYKSTVRGQPLTLPPDLSQSQINPQYSTHDGVASAAAYNQAMAKANKANQGTAVLPEQAGMKILRSGDVRWLQLDRDAALVYPDLIAFWTNEGFTINRDNPAAGVIETDWAENRSKIPGNFLRRALGSIIDVVSDSGERERFTTRLERFALFLAFFFKLLVWLWLIGIFLKLLLILFPSVARGFEPPEAFILHLFSKQAT